MMIGRRHPLRARYGGITPATLVALEDALTSYVHKRQTRWALLSRVMVSCAVLEPQSGSAWPRAFTMPIELQRLAMGTGTGALVRFELPTSIPSPWTLRKNGLHLTFGYVPTETALSFILWHEMAHCLHLYRYFRRFHPSSQAWGSRQWYAKAENAAERLRIRLARPADVAEAERTIEAVLRPHRSWDRLG